MSSILFINFAENKILYHTIIKILSEYNIDHKFFYMQTKTLSNPTPDDQQIFNKCAIGIYLGNANDHLTKLFKSHGKPLITKSLSVRNTISDIHTALNKKDKKYKGSSSAAINTYIKNRSNIHKKIMNANRTLKRPTVSVAGTKSSAIAETKIALGKPLIRSRVKIQKPIKHVKPRPFKVIVVIYTYERLYMLQNILYALHNNDCNATNIELSVFIYDDGSKKEYRLPGYYNFKIKYYRFLKNHGKTLWFQFIDYIYKDIKKYSFDYVIFLPDDCCIKTDFLSQCVNMYRQIKDKKCVTLTLNNDRNSCWNQFKYQEYTKDILLSQWMEMAFICDKRYFKVFDYSIKDFNRSRKTTSSGVPKFLSFKLFKLGFNMYLCKKSLIYTSTANSSVMVNDITKRQTSQGY